MDSEDTFIEKFQFILVYVDFELSSAKNFISSTNIYLY